MEPLLDIDDSHELLVRILYIFYIILSMLVCMYVLPKMCVKLYNLMQYDIRDGFKITQLVFIIMFLITRNAFCFLLFIHKIEFFYIPAISVPAFFFYFYLLINDLLWICFIMHLKEINPQLRSEDIRKKTWGKEILLLILTGAIMIATFLTLIGILIFALSFQCYDCEIYDQDKSKCTQTCRNIHSFSVCFMGFMLGTGILLAVCQIIIGFFLLKTMKRRLNRPYDLIKRKIIITMFFTAFVMGANTLFNLCIQGPKSYTIFSILYVANVHDYRSAYIVFYALAEFLIYFFEILLLWSTMNNIDYREYLLLLTMGINDIKFIAKVSLFLVHAPHKQHQNLEDEGEDDDIDFSTLEKTATEEVKKELDDYDMRSQRGTDSTEEYMNRNTDDVFQNRRPLLDHSINSD